MLDARALLARITQALFYRERNFWREVPPNAQVCEKSGFIQSRFDDALQALMLGNARRYCTLRIDRVGQQQRRTAAFDFCPNTVRRTKLTIKARQIPRPGDRLSVDGGDDVTNLQAQFLCQ